MVIRFSTEALGLASHSRSRMDPREAASQADALSVVLAQPHRRDAKDPRSTLAGTALGRFCALPGHPGGIPDYGLRAGQTFGEIVRQARNALGLPVEGSAMSDRGYAELDDTQLRAAAKVAGDKLGAAEGVLRHVHPRTPSAMRDLVYFDLDPKPGDHGILVGGLIKLAILFGYLKFRPDIAG